MESHQSHTRNTPNFVFSTGVFRHALSASTRRVSAGSRMPLSLTVCDIMLAFIQRIAQVVTSPFENEMITLTQYINHRLGSTSKEQAINFLAKPFGARSLAEFWQYWNPVWNYYLYFYCYRPLRKVLPRWLCVLLTFFMCGLAHDLPFCILSYAAAGRPPLFTITFFLSLNGVLVVVTELLNLRLTKVPVFGKWLTHIATLLTGYQVAVVMTTSLAAR